MKEWQPIETAPKDGTRFVALIPRQGVRFRSSPWIPVECYWEKGLKEPRFVFNNWGSRDMPTHWQPLPAPPE